MKRPWLILLLLAPLACKTTPEEQDLDGDGENDEVTIPADDLEPMGTFVLETRRLLVAEFVRIEMTPQYFEEKMGYTRDFRFVDRKQLTLADGTRVIELKNLNTEQKTNIDPDLLPRVYFGSGLEIRAYNTIRIYLRGPRDKKRPLRLEILGKNASGDAMLYVSGRLQHEKPSIRIRSELIWSEDRERFIHRSSVG